MKQIFDFYKKKKTLSWLIIVITSIIEPTLLIIWIPFITYGFVKKVDLFSSKIIDKKFNNKEWDKKMKNSNKDWDVKLKKIDKNWKKNPIKGIAPVLGIVLGIFFFSNYFFGSSPKNFKSPAGHSFKQVSNCVAFYREVFKYTGTLAEKNKEYVNAHQEYMDFQEKVLKKVISKFPNMDANEILQSVENSSDFNQYEKDSIDGFVDAKLSYANSSSQENSMKKFFCIIQE
jgi:hypothetical protein